MARMTLVNVDGRRDIATITFPAEAGPWWEFYPTFEGRIAPTPTLVRVRPYECVDECDAGETAPDARPISHAWPIAFHGTIGGPGDIDAFSIPAHKRRRHSGRELRGTDRFQTRYDAGDLRPRRRVDRSQRRRLHTRQPGCPPTDGRWSVSHSDRGQAGDGGPGHIYRVEIEQSTKNLTLFLPGPSRKSQDRQVVAVPAAIESWLTSALNAMVSTLQSG